MDDDELRARAFAVNDQATAAWADAIAKNDEEAIQMMEGALTLQDALVGRGYSHARAALQIGHAVANALTVLKERGE